MLALFEILNAPQQLSSLDLENVFRGYIVVVSFQRMHTLGEPSLEIVSCQLVCARSGELVSAHVSMMFPRRAVSKTRTRNSYMQLMLKLRLHRLLILPILFRTVPASGILHGLARASKEGMHETDVDKAHKIC